jgi:ElaB/YqjD/DUF883 family membrane-anchored ribosome-binding protein
MDAVAIGVAVGGRKKISQRSRTCAQCWEAVVIENNFWAIVCTGFAIGFIVVLMI